jgi:hypothetical protein
MGKAAIQCETVIVTVTDEAGNQSSTVMPAFTRSREEMLELLSDIAGEYIGRSVAENSPMSVGDFALYAVTRAASEPRTQG